MCLEGGKLQEEGLPGEGNMLSSMSPAFCGLRGSLGYC